MSFAVSFYDIRLLYIRELRAALRERGIVINSILVPLLLYPVILWLVFSAIGFVQGRQEQLPSRVLLQGLPGGHDALRERLASDERFDLVTAQPSESESDFDPNDPAAAVRASEVDLVATFESTPVASPQAASFELDNFSVELMWNRAEDRSEMARKRFEEVLGTYRAEWLERDAEQLGTTPASWRGFSTERVNLASGEDVGAAVLALIVPLLMMIMIAIGCFYPAIDSTAGERERSTWETSMTLGTSRGNLLVAKYLYVATLGGVAGLLNLIAMTVSMRALLRPMLEGADDKITFSLPWRTLPLMIVAAFVFALFVAAAMMLFATFARTFKEGQAMIGPVYMLTLLPPMLVMSPDLELDLGWALVPVANVTLLFRQAITGDVAWGLALVVLIVQGASILLLLAAARWVLSFEDVAVGSYGGSLGRLIKQRWRASSRTEDSQ